MATARKAARPGPVPASAGIGLRASHYREILIDTHNRPVDPVVWALYAVALKRFGPIPTLIEWDTDLPPLAVLVAEAHSAQRLLEEARRARAA
jgi:uncharacterized protein (UPF0276 family)